MCLYGLGLVYTLRVRNTTIIDTANNGVAGKTTNMEVFKSRHRNTQYTGWSFLDKTVRQKLAPFKNARSLGLENVTMPVE